MDWWLILATALISGAAGYLEGWLVCYGTQFWLKRDKTPKETKPAKTDKPAKPAKPPKPAKARPVPPMWDNPDDTQPDMVKVPPPPKREPITTLLNRPDVVEAEPDPTVYRPKRVYSEEDQT